MRGRSDCRRGDRSPTTTRRTGFAVLKVKVKGRQDLATVVGNTTSVTAGEHLGATGRWVVDREYGQQFRADELKTDQHHPRQPVLAALAGHVFQPEGSSFPGNQNALS
jgi:hypothetical protein